MNTTKELIQALGNIPDSEMDKEVENNPYVAQALTLLTNTARIIELSHMGITPASRVLMKNGVVQGEVSEGEYNSIITDLRKKHKYFILTSTSINVIEREVPVRAKTQTTHKGKVKVNRDVVVIDL